ncbi:MAG TPA: class I SAM-dependent methyltransferase [Candidatus Omnitrophota bacterium]|nr:class I SAM-dependent methyltransferase [Candidatus Omnitrophota bacterium]
MISAEKYSQVFTEQEIKDNAMTAKARREIYKIRGLDFFENRKFIINKAAGFSGNILEVGSGRGNTALSLARDGYSFTSIDVDREMLKCTALNLAGEGLIDKAELFLMDGYRMTFEDNSFKNIIMVEALHHMHDADGLFREIDRVLCPGGKLVLSDFNKRGTEIIEGVHRDEGHMHESSAVGEKEVISWFSGRGYALEIWEDKCHWVVVGGKSSK